MFFIFSFHKLIQDGRHDIDNPVKIVCVDMSYIPYTYHIEGIFMYIYICAFITNNNWSHGGVILNWI